MQLIVTSGQMEPEENVTFFTLSFIITFLLIDSFPVLNSDVFLIQATFLNFRTKNGTHWETQRFYRIPTYNSNVFRQFTAGVQMFLLSGTG